MAIPHRILALQNRHALVDGIPFKLPVRCEPSPVLMACFPINADKARDLMPREVHPFRLWNNKGLLVVTVINYLATNIGKYIEYSLAIACTHGLDRAPRMLPGLLMKRYGTGQYVLDLPVSTEVSVKGGKGIWGMPKHRTSLDFKISDDKVSSQYELDQQLVAHIEIDRPQKKGFGINVGAANYCAFRGMLMKSYIYFKGDVHTALFSKAKARLTLGDHPRAAWMKSLDIEDPIMTAYIPNAVGTLDDHYEGWFLSHERPPQEQPEGLESVIDLGLSEEWPEPPHIDINNLNKENNERRVA